MDNQTRKDDNKAMVYLSPVDWQWIKQRPQFVAVELSKLLDIIVLYPWKNNRKGLQTRQSYSFPVFPYWTIPTLSGRLKFFDRINRWLIRAQFFVRLKRQRYDYLWLSHPNQLDTIPKRFQTSVIYDCMDDYEAIEADKNKKHLVASQEAAVVAVAETIFVSSLSLRDHLVQKRRADVRKISLIRNAYDSAWAPSEASAGTTEGVKRIGYFGTIGRWFDFDLICKSLEAFSDIEYHLYGPLENGIKLPEHERLVYHGVVTHEDIPQKAASLNALIMPFMLNDIVRSVDPVKLYEYILLGKPIIAVRYPEIERFGPFVWFYDNDASFIDCLERLLIGESIPYAPEGARAFLAQNTWQKRAEQIIKELGIHKGENQ